MSDSGDDDDALAAAQAHILAIARRLALVDDDELPAVADLVSRAASLPGGIDEGALVGFLQAYGRGVDRIAWAEADIAARRLAEVPREEVTETMSAWLDEILPLARDAFHTFHSHRVRHLLARRVQRMLSEGALPEADQPTSVSLVDLRNSTGYMVDRSTREIEDLVDSLYLLTGEIAVRHEVSAGKFLGDGVMFISRNRDRLVAATRDAVDTLARRTPLEASGGVAHGEIIRRAGDWFGTPVNLAARLVEIAGPGEILVDAPALPGETTVARWRTVSLRGLPEPRRVAVV